MSEHEHSAPAAPGGAKAIPAVDWPEFERRMADDPAALSRHPFIIRGLVEQWVAFETWNSLGALKKRFGALPVTAGAPQFTTHKAAAMCQVKTTFERYLNYVEAPERLEALFEGQWVKGDPAALKALGLPLYSGNLRLAQHGKAAAFDELQPLVPPGLDCFNHDIPYYFQSGNHLWLYVSREGALTPLHQDNNAVIAYLGQLSGKKRAILYPPRDKAHFYSQGIGYLDPLRPDDEEFPSWREAEAWTGDLSAGELLIWGSEWAHHVVTIEPSITVSYDIVNASNLAGYAVADDWAEELGNVMRKNASLVRERIDAAAVLARLDDGPLPALGRAVMHHVLAKALPGAEGRPRQVKSVLMETIERHFPELAREKATA